jgi:hypothetical protein
MIGRVFAAVAMLLAFSAVSAAHAGVPIPCTATHFIKVTDLPNAKDANGQKIVPYYNVFGCSSSQWDGYATLDGKYHKLNPFVVASLPKAPGFWTSAWQYKTKFWVEWLWIIVGAFVVVGTILSSYAQSFGPQPEHTAKPRS